jgi:hypothetical protein
VTEIAADKHRGPLRKSRGMHPAALLMCRHVILNLGFYLLAAANANANQANKAAEDSNHAARLGDDDVVKRA